MRNRRRRMRVFLRMIRVEVDVCFLRLKGEENTQPIGSWLRVFYSSVHITIAHFSRKGGMTFK